jgi:hypothetical protein
MVAARGLVEPGAHARLTRPIDRVTHEPRTDGPGFTCIQDPYERIDP